MANLHLWRPVTECYKKGGLIKNTTLQNDILHKSPGAKCESYNKFKNSLLKITLLSPRQITFGHFLARCAIFVRHHFMWVSYLSISGGVFVMCHFCEVSLFSNSIKGCFFCWMSLLQGVSDGAVFFIAMSVKKYSLRLSNCNYLLLYQQFQEKLLSCMKISRSF